MTNAQLRAYAKANGISRQEAKERMLAEAKNLSKQEFITNSRNFTWITEDLVDTWNKTGVLPTPAGVNNEVEGIANIQVFEPGKDLPTYALNSGLGVSWVVAKNSSGKNGRNEYFLNIGDDDGYQLCIGVVMKKFNFELISIMLPYALSRLPEHIRSFVYDKVLGVSSTDFLREATCVTAEETALGHIGIIETIV